MSMDGTLLDSYSPKTRRDDPQLGCSSAHLAWIGLIYWGINYTGGGGAEKYVVVAAAAAVAGRAGDRV